MSAFDPKRIAGVDYTFEHLEPFNITVKGKGDTAPEYVVRVSFGFHCFTRDRKAEDTPDLHMIEGKDERSFCFDRYELSKELADMIRYAARGRAYFGEKSNFLIVESVSQHNAPYVAFFDVEKAKKTEGVDGAMFVTSAHLRPALPDKLAAVTFATVVDYRINGKPLKRGETRKVQAQKRK